MKNSKQMKLKDVDFFAIISAIILFIAVALLNYCFPKVCDDITFSMISQTSVFDLLNSALIQGNGRLLGNFFCYLVKFTWFTVAEKTLIWCGIIFLITKLVGSKNNIINIVTAIVMVYPCDSIFAQVYAWNSGFQNYAFPAFIILLDMFLIKNIIQQSNSLKRNLLAVLLILSAFAGQFFSENSSLFAVFLAIAVLIYCIKHEKSARIYSVAYLVATVISFVLMMSYPHILGTNEKIASYRLYADSIGSLFFMTLKNFRLIAKDFTSYFVLWIILSAAFLLIIHKVIDKSYSAKTVKTALSVSKIIIAAYPVFSLFYSVVVKTSITFPRYYFSQALCVSLILYAVALVFVSILWLLQKTLSAKDKLPAVLFVLGAASMAPLLVVSPIGARTFYISFIFLFMSGISVLNKYIEELKINKKSVNLICLLTLCGILSVITMAELDNRYCNNIRNDYLSEEIEKGSDEVVLPLLPHQNLVHEDSNNNTWKNFIRKKYDTEIDLYFIEWNQWYQDYYR